MPQKRVVLRNCENIDPHDITTYLAREGYQALERALKYMKPDEVIEEIKNSGLRGRGGAGFPTGLKWELASKSSKDEKYVICNADEGEVGAFKDRYILEKDPFTLMEAMAIAGYAVGARKGYIYLRAEYSYLLPVLENALAQSKERGFLNNDFKFKIEIRQGAGGYVCGEETALMESIEGKRGEARYKPPFPPSSGLWEKPTVINNVETFMNIPEIILKGSKWFSRLGTEKSKGTKVFSVSGDVERPGIYELIMGSSLKELVEEIALGKKIKMIQVGGLSGRIIPYEKIDVSLSFETVLGAGPIIVFNENRDIIEMVRETIEFFREESCGKCIPCSRGTEIMEEILSRLSQGKGEKGDLKRLEDLAKVMMSTSLCGLGQAAPNAVVDTLKYFRKVYEEKIK